MKILVSSSPVSWALSGLSCNQMPGHFSPDESVWLTSFVLGSPDFALFIDCLLTLNFGYGELSVVTFASGSWSLSDSISDLFACFLVFLHHFVIIIFLWLLDLSQRFGSTSVSHSFFNQWRVNALLLQNFFEFIHRFVLFIGSSVSFQGVLFSESVLLLLDFVVGFFDLFVYFWGQIVLDFHAFHF